MYIKYFIQLFHYNIILFSFRYGGQSNTNYRGNRDNQGQGMEERPGQEGYNNRRGNNYQGQNYQRDNQRQEGGFDKNNGKLANLFKYIHINAIQNYQRNNQSKKGDLKKTIVS